MSDELRDRLSRFADGVGPVGPDLDAIVRRGARRRTRRVGVGAVIAVVAAVAIAAPLYALSGLGQDVSVSGAVPGDIVFSTPMFSHQHAQIFSMAPDGTNLQQLTPDDANYFSVSVSPDGRQMAYVRYERRPDNSSREGIYVANVDGTDAHAILRTREPGTIGVQQLRWSPDGSSIGFISTRVPPDLVLESGSDFAHHLWVMGVDGTDPHALPGDDITSFSWSPDASKIVYSQETQISATGTTRVIVSGLFVMNADGSDPHQLTDETGLYRDPLWSPDGQRITFALFNNGQPLPMIMNADGSDLHLLSPDLAPLSEPLAWSPDAQVILVRQFTRDECVLWSVDQDAGLVALLRGSTSTFGPMPGTPPKDSAACADSSSWLASASSAS